MNQHFEWLVLSQIPGIGTTGFWQLVHHCGSPKDILGCSTKKFAEIPGVTKSQIDGFEKRDEVASRCRNQLDLLAGRGGQLVGYEDGRYPQLLKEIPDPPAVLFVLGNPEILSSASLAIVGSRAATHYGKRTANTLSKRLAEHGITIVSGLALGIDTEAHRGALQVSGKTVAVLGCGLDVVYPSQNKNLFNEIAASGAVVTEYPMGTRPDGFRFPMRNRIIAGMSNGVVVVEAAKKSGSLITAQIALDSGKEIYAIPGQVDSIKSEGSHWLLQQGAKLVQNQMDILEDFPATILQKNDDEATIQEDTLDTVGKHLLTFIEPYPRSRDEILQLSGLDVSIFSESLLILELEGMVEILPGDEICRIQ